MARAIIFALRQAETGVIVSEVCRKMGICEATFYNWKKKYAGLGVIGQLYLEFKKSIALFKIGSLPVIRLSLMLAISISTGIPTPS